MSTNFLILINCNTLNFRINQDGATDSPSNAASVSNEFLCEQAISVREPAFDRLRSHSAHRLEMPTNVAKPHTPQTILAAEHTKQTPGADQRQHGRRSGQKSELSQLELHIDIEHAEKLESTVRDELTQQLSAASHSNTVGRAAELHHE